MADKPTIPLDFSTKKKKKLRNFLPPEPPRPEVAPAAAKSVENVETTKEAPKAKLGDAAAASTGTQPAKKKPAAVGSITEQLDELAFGEKKKKKKGALRPLNDSDLQPSMPTAQGLSTTTVVASAQGGMETEAPAKTATEGAAQSGTTGYPYDMLLARVFAQIQAHNPELMSDTKRRLVMAPPCMARVGTKKTHFTNFNGICRSLNRDPAHLSAYLFAELGTTGSVDANGALLIRGKYQAKHIEPVLRNYARTYVLCSTCQSPDTELSRDSRLLFLQCKTCRSRVTVKSVTSGFQAVTGKRAAIRAKTQ
ncbi:Eukaryotic translation initiation factor 2 subunit 2 [Echinococcus granulosus]|uniref:Eukaryotic translation initiation factor 2 subunit 2 n=1 Tax=Echinococcus granulosus TaxID=6210 RepID=U6JB55_ECHGR|nr:Eukaryotic translation initiation factor 2 subunit 2 [Echinococcus granulosus]EUB58562.1 Eukaryotic translation initiation factor 2 subunit 2 [Echinococcus granulosus]KAH9281214.1 Eukaryotic translation initiation factor 2 subunit 2 [Echinococcus granulosus]CDS19691.1 eukaryotic translation initiation factor 2 [Echinococcus granulosus]